MKGEYIPNGCKQILNSYTHTLTIARNTQHSVEMSRKINEEKW